MAVRRETERVCVRGGGVYDRAGACECVRPYAALPGRLRREGEKERETERRRQPIVDFHRLAAFFFGTVVKAVFHALSRPRFPPLSLQQRFWDN